MVLHLSHSEASWRGLVFAPVCAVPHRRNDENQANRNGGSIIDLQLRSHQNWALDKASWDPEAGCLALAAQPPLLRSPNGWKKGIKKVAREAVAFSARVAWLLKPVPRCCRSWSPAACRPAARAWPRPTRWGCCWRCWWSCRCCWCRRTLATPDHWTAPVPAQCRGY